jgi:hypothetical protein
LLQVAVDIGLQVDELVDVGLEGDDDDE